MGVVLLWEARAMSEQNALVSAGGAQGTSSEQTAGSRRRREEAEEEDCLKGVRGRPMRGGLTMRERGG
jgi:hypothetical protein